MITTPDEVRGDVKRLLPPSVRDREIFERVAGKRDGQAAVAKEFGLTQARVSQIVDLVRAWLAEANEGEAGDLPPQKQLRLAARVVRIRLECLLTETMESWRASHGDLTTVRQPGNGAAVERVTRPSFGDVKYLTAYRHVALALARLDGVPTAPKTERPEAGMSNDQVPMTNEVDIEPVAVAEGDGYVAEAAAEVEAVAAADEAGARSEVTEGCGAGEERKWDYLPGESAQKRAYKKALRERQKRRERADRRDQFLRGNAELDPSVTRDIVAAVR